MRIVVAVRGHVEELVEIKHLCLGENPAHPIARAGVRHCAVKHWYELQVDESSAPNGTHEWSILAQKDCGQPRVGVLIADLINQFFEDQIGRRGAGLPKTAADARIISNADEERTPLEQRRVSR
jgi:hypothetical protein